MKKKGSNKIVITDSFQAWAHKWGRIGTLIALLYMIAIPFVVLTFYDSLPSIGEVINLSTISILMVYIPVGFSEAISYTPILGASSYLTFITGNIMNLKLPCAVNAMKLTKKEPNTPEGEAISSVAVAVCSLTLATSWGGVEYAWNSPVIICLVAAAVLFSVLFAVAEAKAKHPIMPLFLFKNRNFMLTTIGGFIILFATMAAMSYLPTYFQIAHGLSATAAGYMQVPTSIAYLIASTISGVLISKSGRYKKLMAVSFAIATVGTVLIATLTADTTVVLAGLYLAIMGFGMGLSFEVLVLIVQNEFPSDMVGVATSATNFFREIGTTLGASVAGALFTANIASQMADKLAPFGGVAALGFDANSLTPALARTLPDELQHAVAVAYNDALMPVFLLMVPLTVVAGLLMIALKEKPLADSLRDQGSE